jgi:FkbM family methyltransferase
MLWRALKHVEKGVYVDVGAQHPVVDSVSKAFYERGWRGIHIEPVPQYAELLRKDRPDETVLQVALADTEGTLELNVIPDTGLSTFVDAYAQRHEVERGYEHQRVQVPVLTLKSALRSLAGKDVHWLKIDVEGFEEKVIKGWDSQTLRPWVVVIEATIANSPEADYTSWDPILTAAGYQFVYFDGLNRFYVSNEHAELAEAFSFPPNVFDNVQLSGLASSELCRGLIASHLAREEDLAAQAQAHAEWLQNEWDAAKQRVESLNYQSGTLATTLSVEREQKSRRESELIDARRQLEQLQSHGRWLQNEWDAAKAKVDELNHSSHHWWTVADGLNRELQAVYASRSWRLTAPLRKANFFIKELARMMKTRISTLTSLSRRSVRRVLLSAVAHVQSRPDRKAKVARLLARFPRLNARLRAFLWRHSGRSTMIVPSSTIHAMPASPVYSSATRIRWEAYSPSVRNVYQQLTQARARADVRRPQDKKTENAA